jgi:hypothetical protein
MADIVGGATAVMTGGLVWATLIGAIKSDFGFEVEHCSCGEFGDHLKLKFTGSKAVKLLAVRVHLRNAGNAQGQFNQTIPRRTTVAPGGSLCVASGFPLGSNKVAYAVEVKTRPNWLCSQKIVQAFSTENVPQES